MSKSLLSERSLRAWPVWCQGGYPGMKPQEFMEERRGSGGAPCRDYAGNLTGWPAIAGQRANLYRAVKDWSPLILLIVHCLELCLVGWVICPLKNERQIIMWSSCRQLVLIRHRESSKNPLLSYLIHVVTLRKFTRAFPTTMLVSAINLICRLIVFHCGSQ